MIPLSNRRGSFLSICQIRCYPIRSTCLLSSVVYRRKQWTLLNGLVSSFRRRSHSLCLETKAVLKDINNVVFRSCNTLEEKQYKMIAYAFEKAYDLAISPARNVSRNPGFETPLGFFG